MPLNSNSSVGAGFFNSGLTLCWVALLILSLVSAAEVGEKPAAAQAAASGASGPDTETQQSLVPHRQVEREISSGQLHSYRLSAKSGQFFRLLIGGWGVRTSLAVYNPAGQLQAEFDLSQDELTPASVITDASGSYSLKVRAKADGASGGYSLLISEMRKRSKHDELLIHAEQNFAKAERFRAECRIQAYQEAIELYEEARTSAQTAGDRVIEAEALKNAGAVYEALNETENALAHYHNSLSLSQRLGDRRAQSDTLNRIAYLNYGFGNNQKALSSAQNALALSRQSNNRRGEARALFTMGEAYYGFGDLKKAVSYYNQALQIWRQFNDKRGQAQVLISIGYAHGYTDEVLNARQALQQGLELSKAAGDIRWEAISLRALGSLETNLGDSQRALDYFQQALEKLKLVDDRLIEATVLGGMGYTYERLGDNQRALEFDLRAVAIFQAINNSWGEAELQMDLGRVYYLVGNSTESLGHHDRALSLFRALGMVRYQAQTLRDLGAIYNSWGQNDKALAYYKESLALNRKGQDQRYEAYTLNYLGSLIAASGKTDQAFADYQRALKLSRGALDPSGEALSLYNLARLERDRGRLTEALAYSATALHLVESIRVRVLSSDSRATYFATVGQHHELYIDILMRLSKSRPNDGLEAQAFDVSERARARSFLETLKEARANIREGVDQSLLERERSLDRALNARAKRLMELTAKKNDNEAAALGREVDALTAQYQQVRDQIKATSPHYAALTQPQPLSLAEIQQQVLDDKSLLLEYMLGDEKSYVWAVTRTEISSFELRGRKQIEAAACAYYDLLKAHQPLPNESLQQRQTRVSEANTKMPQALETLSELVLGPLGDKLGSKRLIIVPDGALQYIPFQALTVPRSQAAGGGTEPLPLILSHEIVNEPSASALALVLNETAQRQQAPGSVAVLAHPVFDTDDPRVRSSRAAEGKAAREPSSAASSQAEVQEAFRDVGFGEGRIPTLPASREEAEAIISVAPWRSAFKALGFEASRATLNKPELGQYRIVHFATHGFVDYERPELSGLVLSLVDETGNPQDGFLRLHDIYNLKLSADLVVLSACNTGLGKDVRGEGLIGLTRGFMYAGAAGVAASLWKVDDEATAELMKRFYEGLFNEGLTPAAALRQAQIAMWRQQRWHEPYYWAAFVIQGQYDQTPNRGFGWTRTLKWAAAPMAVASAVALVAFLLVRRRRRQVL